MRAEFLQPMIDALLGLPTGDAPRVRCPSFNLRENLPNSEETRVLELPNRSKHAFFSCISPLLNIEQTGHFTHGTEEAYFGAITEIEK